MVTADPASLLASGFAHCTAGFGRDVVKTGLMGEIEADHSGPQILWPAAPNMAAPSSYRAVSILPPGKPPHFYFHLNFTELECY